MRRQHSWRFFRVGDPLSGSPLSTQELDRQRARQALEQQRVAFEQRRRQTESTFRLQRAMGWTTFVAVPLGVALAFIEPWTLTATAPLNALAFWNWRRLLRQEQPVLTPTTTPPDSDPPEV